MRDVWSLSLKEREKWPILQNDRGLDDLHVCGDALLYGLKKGKEEGARLGCCLGVRDGKRYT